MQESLSLPILDLVDLDRDVSAAARALPHADRWQWRVWSSLEEFEAQFDAEPDNGRVNLFVAVDTPSRLDARVLRELQGGHRRIDIVVLARDFDAGELKRFLGHGVSNIERLPLPPFTPEALLRERRQLALLFPGEPRGRRRETFEFELPALRDAVPPLVRTLCERCESLGYPHEFVRSHLPLVVDEAVTNAMAHGCDWDATRVVRVVAVLTAERIEIVVCDDGEGFERAEVADPLSGENRRREGGRGLFLMESLMDEVEYRDGGRTVVLRKRVGTHERAGEPVAG